MVSNLPSWKSLSPSTVICFQESRFRGMQLSSPRKHVVHGEASLSLRFTVFPGLIPWKMSGDVVSGSLFFAKKCSWSEQSKVINVIFTCLASQQSQIGAPTWLFVGYIFPFSFEEGKHNNHDWPFRSSCNGDYPRRNSSFQLIQWNNRMDESSIVGRYEVGARLSHKQ